MRVEKKFIVQKIKDAAKLYKSELVGKVFLIIYEKGFIELLFKTNSFAHLTGVEIDTSANIFYKRAINNQLTEKDINFSDRHPINLCINKVFQLEYLPKIKKSDGFVLEKIHTNTTTFKFGFTDLHFTLCLCEDKNASSKPGSSKYYIPQSFRFEDCFDKSDNVYEIYAILEKETSSSDQYEKIDFQTKKNIELSEELKNKLSQSTISILSE